MSEQSEQTENAAGNTKNCRVNSERQYNYWCFTLNNYTNEQSEQLEHILKSECRWFIFQEEKGEEGTPHLQGIVNLAKKQRLTGLKKIDPRIHWEPTKSVKASIAYCIKNETRCGRQWIHGIEVPEEIEVEKPKGWQLHVMDIINSKPDKRTIHWFWESVGGVGKSELCKYLVVKHNALMLTGKSNDMYNMLAKHPTRRKLIICDIPRSSIGYINYAAIEQIKNGLVFSGKYEGTQLVFNTPHVIVFANEAPDYSQMSGDRWNVVNITNIL